MWLITTFLAALISSLFWYLKRPGDKYKLGTLSLFFWGATVMWLVDHIMAYIKEGGAFFEISRDGTYLGISVIILGVLVWLLILLFSRPGGVFKRTRGSKA
jgi:hypothetical protein